MCVVHTSQKNTSIARQGAAARQRRGLLSLPVITKSGQPRPMQCHMRCRVDATTAAAVRACVVVTIYMQWTTFSGCRAVVWMTLLCARGVDGRGPGGEEGGGKGAAGGQRCTGASYLSICTVDSLDGFGVAFRG